MKTTIQADIPPALLAEANAFIDAGWSNGLDELLAEALRRYLDSHATSLTETFAKEDAAWGLYGKD